MNISQMISEASLSDAFQEKYKSGKKIVSKGIEDLKEKTGEMYDAGTKKAGELGSAAKEAMQDAPGYIKYGVPGVATAALGAGYAAKKLKQKNKNKV